MLDWKPIDDAAKNGDEVILNTGAVAWWGDLNAADSEFGRVKHQELWCWLIDDGKNDPIHYRPIAEITHYCAFVPPSAEQEGGA